MAFFAWILCSGDILAISIAHTWAWWVNSSEAREPRASNDLLEASNDSTGAFNELAGALDDCQDGFPRHLLLEGIASRGGGRIWRKKDGVCVKMV